MKTVTCLRCICFALLLASFATRAAADDHPAVTFTRINDNVPAENAYIIRFYVDQPSPNSSYETGNLHILYVPLLALWPALAWIAIAVVARVRGVRPA